MGRNSVNSGADPSNSGLAPAVGNKGNILWVQDAGYSVAGSPSNGKQFVYSYNGYGQKVSETNLNGVVTNYTYGGPTDIATVNGPVGNLTQTIQDVGTGTLNRTTKMTYDIAGHVLQATDPSNLTSYFAYNNLGQPTGATLPATAAQPTGESLSYTYDGGGRTTQVSDNRGVTMMAYVPNSDWVWSVSDPVTGTTSYSYRQDGLRSAMTLAGGVPGTTRMVCRTRC